MARVTVLFSTFNGAHTLPRMLDSLERLEPPTGGWKVVAVDNSSTDNSLHILQQRAAKLPMTVISEHRRGKNVALNAGLALSGGDIVALTDDDVILPVNWLIAIENVAAQNTDYDIFGGAIHPIWEETPPDWVLRCVPKPWFSWTDYPEGPTDPHLVWGPSMAVRAAVFRKLRFAENIGPNGSISYAMGSETEFTMRAANSGHRCWHFRDAPVGHIVRPRQLKREWLLQRAYNQGRGDRRKFGINDESRFARLLGYPRHVTRRVVFVVASRLFGNTDDRFKASARLRYWQGDVDERRDLRKRIKTGAGMGSPGS
jgi:glycosyltransferase involved in cell wall biosynthesis